MQRIIAFSGPKKSGKDTAARFLLARNSFKSGNYFKQHNYADSLKRVCMEVFGLTWEECNDQILKETVLTRFPFVTPRQIMQDVAKMFRTFYGGDVWVNRWKEKLATPEMMLYDCVLITDLRHPEELSDLKSRGAKIVYVQNDRVENELKIERASGDKLSSDVSESHYALMKVHADYILSNNSGLTELQTAVRITCSALYSDWKDWQ